MPAHTENARLARSAYDEYQTGDDIADLDQAEVVASEIDAIIRLENGLPEDFDVSIHDDFGFKDALAVAYLAGVRAAKV